MTPPRADHERVGHLELVHGHGQVRLAGATGDVGGGGGADARSSPAGEAVDGDARSVSDSIVA
jgi:hypothetical protein